MAFFDKAGFDKLPAIEEKIRLLFAYLGKLESSKIVILKNLNLIKDAESRKRYEERFKELCEKAEGLGKEIIKLNREQRKIAIKDIEEIQKRLKKLKQKGTR